MYLHGFYCCRSKHEAHPIGSDGKIDTISIGEIELTISDSIELDFPVQIIGIGPTKTIVIGTDVQDGFKIISANNNGVSHIQNLTIKDTVSFS